MHKRKKTILPEQEFPEKKCVLIGIVIGVSLGLLLGVTCYAEVCRWESALAEPPDFVWGLPLVQHFRKNNRKSEHRTKLLNLLCAVLFYFVR